MAQEFYSTLIDSTKPVGDRYFCVFQLKNIGTDQAIKSLIDAYAYCGTSILLKHQLLYALGQLSQDKYQIVRQFLKAKMNDEHQNSLSRHEAAEALGNYFDENIGEYYEKHLNSKCNQLRWTCEIAKQKIKHKQLKKEYGLQYNRTMQPAAPYSEVEFLSLIQSKHLQKQYKENKYIGVLCSQKLSLFQKYRIMYHMRNKKTQECISALCRLLSKQYYKTQTSLLKHEICFILGQIGYDIYEDLIRQCVQNEDEEDIVRHQALAAVASQSKDPEYLQKFVDPKYPQLIRESAQVAIHSIKYWSQ